jgi:ribokinase
MGARRVAITLGERGTMLWDSQSSRHVEPFAITAVDTTAAGDAFAGALAVRWAETDQLEDAVRFANAAGALAATREGAQPGMASRAEIEALWREPS